MTFSPITREEYYLAKMAGLYNGNTPKPILRAEYYLARACGDYDGNLPDPVTRYDKYLARIAGENIPIPNPVSRIEWFLLAIIDGVDYKNLSIPITRKEKLLYEIIKNNGYTLVTQKGKGQIIATGTMDGVPFEQIVMQGWTKQITTTGAQLFNQLTVTENKYVSDTDGELRTATNIGKALNASDYIDVSGLGQIFISKTNTSEWAAFYDSDKVYISGFTGYGKVIAVPEGASYARFTVAKESMGIFMVNAGATAQPWEPYSGGLPSPSPDYPQEVVSAGLYDDGSEKYKINLTVTDGNEKQQNVLLASDRLLTQWDRLEKRDGVWGWVYKGIEYTVTGEENFQGDYPAREHVSNRYFVSSNILQNNNPLAQNAFCNRAKFAESPWNKDLEYTAFSCNANQIHLALLNDDTGITQQSTAEEVTAAIKQYLKTIHEAGTPFKVWYETELETFVPLSESEQSALNALTTYYPTTVISNGQDCEMEVTYKTINIGSG